MSSNQEHSSATAEQIEEQVRQAVADGRNIGREVERITAEALSLGRLELARVKEIISGVALGASAGADNSPANGREAVSEALDGLQGALLQTFNESRLAIEEAVSRADSYSEAELKQRLDEIRDLETTMLDTLSAAARSGAHAGSEIVEDLVGHARRSGTRLGSEIDSSMRALARSLPEALRETAVAGLGAARETSARAAEVASGLFRGFANAMRDPDNTKDTDTGQDGER